MPGKLITIEGPDGTGKQTQTKLLVESLSKKFKVASMQFPRYDTPSGQKVRDYLDGKLGTMDNIDPLNAARLYYEDRKANLQELLGLLNEHDFVILDRYKYSNQIYQPARFPSPEQDDLITKIREMESDLPEADLVIHMHIPAEISQKLMKNQGRKKDLHESNMKIMLEQINVYNKIAEFYKQTHQNWITIDCIRNSNLKSIASIHEDIISSLSQKFPEIPAKKQEFYFDDLIKFGNPDSNIGILTCWTKIKLLDLPSDSYFAMGQLYSKNEGISALIRNCLMNKKIRHLIVTGNDLGKGGKALLLLSKNSVDENNNIIGIENAYIDKEIPKQAIDKFRENVQIHDMRGRENELPTYIKTLPRLESYGEPESFPEPELKMPEKFPTDHSVFKIAKPSIGEAWIKILETIMRFGVLKKSQYSDNVRELINLTTVITEEDTDNPNLGFFDFNKEDLEKYLPQVITSNPVEGVEYTYGQRLRNHDGIDQINSMTEQLKNAIFSRRAVAVTWNVKKDHNNEKSPCLDLIQALVQDNKLFLTAYIRSNDMYGAWPLNAYALRKLQKEMATKLGISMGSLTTISASAHIYETSWKKALEKMKKYKQHAKRIGDPRGNFRISIENGKIIVTHLDSENKKLAEYSGISAMEIYLQLAQDQATEVIGHALYLGTELQKAEIALQKNVKYVQDEKLDI